MPDLTFLTNLATPALGFLVAGGPSIWAIAALSVLTLAIILWKIWDLAWRGAWSAERPLTPALAAWAAGDQDTAQGLLAARRGARARVARAAMTAASTPEFDLQTRKDEALRVAKAELAHLRAGLRTLELIATVAPLLGLLGTVMGMISAFQALQDAGSRADPSMLAGGIWEALLTTAAGMAVAIPASATLTWFESIHERLRLQMEDTGTRVFQHVPPGSHRLVPAIPAAAE